MESSVKFRVFRRFNEEALAWAARSKFRLDHKSAPYFTGERLAERIVWALAERRAISVKETLESFETFSRVRRRLRAPHMADVCCGHGLTGLLFAAAERQVEDVILFDQEKPSKADLIVEAVVEAAPWVASKVTWVEDDVSRAAKHLAPKTSVVAVHACGVRTDRALEAAAAVGGDVAVVPCCYAQTAPEAPLALREKLGNELATDIHRTYWLEARGYLTDWAEIPRAITPKNRIIVGMKPRG
jgi:hypothetical protein